MWDASVMMVRAILIMAPLHLPEPGTPAVTGLCNGHDNCDDGSDEAQCTGAMSVSVESTSGRTITVETLSTSTGTFHDREYAFRSHWQCTS